MLIGTRVDYKLLIENINEGLHWSEGILFMNSNREVMCSKGFKYIEVAFDENKDLDNFYIKLKNIEIYDKRDFEEISNEMDILKRIVNIANKTYFKKGHESKGYLENGEFVELAKGV